MADYLLQQSPQEWKWLLQEEGLLSPLLGNEIPLDDNSNSDDVLPSHVGQALDTLLRTSLKLDTEKRELTLLEESQESLHHRRRILERLSSKQRNASSSSPNKNDLRNELENRMETAITKHQSLLVEAVQLYDSWWTTSSTLQYKHLTCLRQVMSSSSSSSSSNARKPLVLLQQQPQLMTDLNELHASFQLRVATQKSLPTFLQQNDKVYDYEVTRDALEEMMNDLNTGKDWNDWKFHSVYSPHNNNKNHCNPPEQQQRLRVQLDQTRVELESTEDSIRIRRDAVMALELKIESWKMDLQQLVTSLFDFEDEVEIIL